MAERYEDRYREESYRGEPYRGERDYERDERGFMDRAGDEVRSWFGDEDAEYRRRMDETMRERDQQRSGSPGRSYGMRGQQGRNPDWRARGYRDESARWSADRPAESGRSQYDRPSNPHESAGYRGYRGFSKVYADEAALAGRGRVGWPEGPYEERGGRTATPQNDFTGRGPKGYQRSDARINEEVCDRLAEAWDVDASDIEVRVTGGEVTLSGTVHNRMEKRRAEDLVENLSGVREVRNELRVGGTQTTNGQSTTTTGGSMGAAGPTRR